MDVYRDTILDHYHNPRNFGFLPKPTSFHEEENTSCGDRIRIDIEIVEKNGNTILSDIRFSGEGCAISQAASSMLSEFVKGKPIRKILSEHGTLMIRLLQTPLTPSRMKCATLPLEVLQKAIMKNLE